MRKASKYGVFGVGRIGKVHASIVQQQGHQIVAIGGEAQATTRFSFITTGGVLLCRKRISWLAQGLSIRLRDARR